MNETSQMVGRVRRLALCAGALALSALLAGGCSPQGGPSDAPAPGSAGAASAAAQAPPDAAPSSAPSGGASASSEPEPPSAPAQEGPGPHAEADAADLRLAIDGLPIEVAWEDNESVAALAQRAAEGPVEVRMSPHGGFEQFGPLGFDLPNDDAQTTTGPGDVVLYAGDQVVVFYGSNSWAYTRLGKITGKDAGELADMLGGDAVTLTISAAR